MTDWIEWKGGECPVLPDRQVEVRFRAGSEDRDVADLLYWHHGNGPSDIVAYRVLSGLTLIRKAQESEFKFQVGDKQSTLKFMVRSGSEHEPVLTLDEGGFTYKGQRIEDAGEAHRAFLEVMGMIRKDREAASE